jgi:glycosyltransferase involved in cell wall biosynthesis
VSAGEAVRAYVVSPYHGGSHASWAEGLQRNSRHAVEIHSLPARFWKWRMHGAALTLAARLAEAPVPDVIVATDMLDLSTFLGATRRTFHGARTILYMHENQLTYPLPDDPTTGAMRRQGGERDRHYGFINFASMAVADRIVFNSEFHRDEVFEALPPFLSHFPEHRELDRVAELRARSTVLPVGVETSDVPEPDDSPRPPLVVWNQRWEYDKNPGALFELLGAVAARGVEFEVALCGEQFGQRPAGIDRGIATLGARVVHQGYLPRAEYVELLGRSRVVVSTAHHEFFGVSVVEAAMAGAMPLWPRRLSYPELLAPDHREKCLYPNHGAAVERLAAALVPEDPTRTTALAVAASLRERFAWQRVITEYDELLSGPAAG